MIPTLKRQGQESQKKFKAIFNYIMSSRPAQAPETLFPEINKQTNKQTKKLHHSLYKNTFKNVIGAGEIAQRLKALAVL